MTPKEKAVQLYFEMLHHSTFDVLTETSKDAYNRAKQCALIAVDEIIKIEYWASMEMGGRQEEEYWKQVKNEIEKL